MAYLQELKRRSSEIAGAFPSSEVQIIGRKKCVIAGHKGLYSLTTEEVVVRRRGDRILVRGAGLRVEDADEGEIRIGGEILSVEFLPE